MLDGCPEVEIRVGALPTIQGDRTQLRALLQNLVSNAAKFSGEATEPLVSISAERLDNNWRFAVVDNGIGIPTEQGRRISSHLSSQPGTPARAFAWPSASGQWNAMRRDPRRAGPRRRQ